MYCSSRSFPDVMFEFVFPAKFPAYKLLPPLCLVSILSPPSCTSCNYFFLWLNSFLPISTNNSRSYGFLSLINYRIARGACCDLESPFFPFPISFLSICVLRFSAQRRVALRLASSRVISRRLASRRLKTRWYIIVKERSAVRDFVNETRPSLVPCARRINWAFNYAVSCKRPAERQRDVYARVCPSRLAFRVPLTTTTRATGDTPR